MNYGVLDEILGVPAGKRGMTHWGPQGPLWDPNEEEQGIRYGVARSADGYTPDLNISLANYIDKNPGRELWFGNAGNWLRKRYYGQETTGLEDTLAILDLGVPGVDDAAAKVLGGAAGVLVGKGTMAGWAQDAFGEADTMFRKLVGDWFGDTPESVMKKGWNDPQMAGGLEAIREMVYRQHGVDPLSYESWLKGEVTPKMPVPSQGKGGLRMLRDPRSMNSMYVGKTTPVSAWADWPNLNEHIPGVLDDLSSNIMQGANIPHAGRFAAYDSDANRLILGPGLSGESLENLIPHELSHLAQYNFGFGVGGGPSEFIGVAQKSFIDEGFSPADITPDMINKRAHDIYLRLNGEHNAYGAGALHRDYVSTNEYLAEHPYWSAFEQKLGRPESGTLYKDAQSGDILAPHPNSAYGVEDIPPGVNMATDDVPPRGPLDDGPTEAPRRGTGRSRERIGSTGQYIGAPRGIDTPEKLMEMRESYIDTVAAGVEGRDWYDDASQWISDLTNDVGEAEKARIALGTTSQGANVNANTGWGIKGMAQGAAGVPVKTGRFPNRASPKIEAALRGEDTYLGPKLDPFAQDIAVNWNPERARHPVHDIWQGRTFGYKNADGTVWDQGFSPAQHAFMDEQMDIIVEELNKRKIGGMDDWTPLKAQAAGWTGEKIKAGDILPTDAAKHFGDYAGGSRVAATYEQVPGLATGQLKGIQDMPFDVRQQYSDMASWKDPKGRDALYASTGVLTEPTIPALGTYKPQGGPLELNPAEVAHPLVGMDMLDNNKRKWITPDSVGILDDVETLRAFTDAQNAGAWHRMFPGNNPADVRTSFSIDLHRTPSRQEMSDLSELADRYGFFISDSGDGISIINNPWSPQGEARTGKQLTKDLKGKMGEDFRLAVGGGDITRAEAQSNLLDLEGVWKGSNEGSGFVTGTVLDQLERNPHLLKKLDSEALRKKALDNLNRDYMMAEKYGLPIRSDIQNARRIISEGGLKALREAWKSGAILPAVGGAVFAPLLLQEEAYSEPSSM